ncbi:MAG: hypothetical protein FWC47_13110 [Oscillospiraceae bacterium]|nr:hypothetical protein [Oscillospiraceae bacterium]
MQEKLNELKNALIANKDKKLKMVLGFDGFVDEIIHVVAKRQDFHNFKRVNTIKEFSERIGKAAGLGTNIEFVTMQTKLGGNGPILANAFIEYGVDVTYIGSIGDPAIHPVFLPISNRAHAVSLCEPGHTDAIEFDDGKLMLGKHFSLNEVNWNRIKERSNGLSGFVDLIKDVDLFGMENWTMLGNMSDIWEGVIDDVFPLLPDRKEKPIAFFDLADPEKRSKEDILRSMNLISKFQEKYKVILGLNEKEAFEIAEVFDINLDDSLPREEMLKQIVIQNGEKLKIDCLVVHPTKEAMVYADGEYYYTKGPYCPKPVLTTGAGDNFNAGFCFGQALGLDYSLSLLLGVCTSGFYVRKAKSPSLDEILTFITEWENGEI